VTSYPPSPHYEIAANGGGRPLVFIALVVLHRAPHAANTTFLCSHTVATKHKTVRRPPALVGSLHSTWAQQPSRTPCELSQRMTELFPTTRRRSIHHESVSSQKVRVCTTPYPSKRRATRELASGWLLHLSYFSERLHRKWNDGGCRISCPRVRCGTT